MVLNKFAAFVSAATDRLSSTKTSSIPNVSSGLPPLPASLYNYSLGQKNKLRLSSSLQDHSAYRRHDLDDVDINVEIKRGSTNANKSNFFQRETANASPSKEKGPPVVASTRKKWMRAVFVFLCFVVVCFLPGRKSENAAQSNSC